MCVLTHDAHTRSLPLVTTSGLGTYTRVTYEWSRTLSGSALAGALLRGHAAGALGCAEDICGAGTAAARRPARLRRGDAAGAHLVFGCDVRMLYSACNTISRHRGACLGVPHAPTTAAVRGLYWRLRAPRSSGAESRGVPHARTLMCTRPRTSHCRTSVQPRYLQDDCALTFAHLPSFSPWAAAELAHPLLCMLVDNRFWWT